MVAEAGLLAMGADRWGIPVFRIVAGMGVELQASGLCVQVVEARSGVRDRLRTEGVEQKLGGINRATSVADAVEAFQKSGTS
jgi:hypothetical protein